MFGNKGIIFIIDLIVACAVLTIALIFFISVAPSNTIKMQNDLVYLEAQNYIMNFDSNKNIDFNNNYLCRNYIKPIIENSNIMIEDKNICTNVVG